MGSYVFYQNISFSDEIFKEKEDSNENHAMHYHISL